MKKEIEIDIIAKEVVDYISAKNVSVLEAKLIVERLPQIIDTQTKLKPPCVKVAS